MSPREILSCAALVALSWVSPAWAAGQPLEFAVKKPHLIGASHGTLVFSDQGVEYKTTDGKDARRWSYEQIKQIQVLSPTRVAIRTYEDQGWSKGWADRDFRFEVTQDRVTPDLVAFLLAKNPRAIVTAVLPPTSEQPLYRIPVKHVRVRHGSNGDLLLFRDRLVYQADRLDASRSWRFGDVASVLALDRYRLEVTTYEGGGGDTRPFTFQLKTDLPRGFYDTLWAAVNPPAPLTSGNQPSQRRHPESE